MPVMHRSTAATTAALVTALVIIAGCAGPLPAGSPGDTTGPSPSPIAAGSPAPATIPRPTMTPPTAVATTASPAVEPEPTPTPTPAPTEAASPTPRPKRDNRGCPLRANASLRELKALDRTLLVDGRALDFDGTIAVWARNGSYQAGIGRPARRARRVVRHGPATSLVR